jgi:translocator protein
MDLTLFLTYLAACFAAAAGGGLIQPGGWYDSLQKPSWTPPRWAFPVVWTTLYLFMAYAAMRVGLKGVTDPNAAMALALWSVQIAINTLWTPVFFGLRRMKAGLVIIGLLWLAVAATMVAFFRVDLVAGLLFVPYLVWVSAATALNASVVRLNPGANGIPAN